MSHFKKIRFTLFQLIVLSFLSCILCGICAGIGWVVSTEFSVPSQGVAAGPPPTSLPLEATPVPSPTLAATPTPSPSPLPTVMPSTAVPSPTATYVVAPALINKDKIGQIIQFVELNRQLALPTAMPIEFLTRRQLREQWRVSSVDAVALEAAQTQQEFYRALGLVEPQVDLVQAAFDSQTDITLGYYTPKEKVMYIVAESVNMFSEEEMTFAHEYVHALQDYHFNLNQVFEAQLSGDALLAARSLPEGDARLVEDLFTSQNIRQEELDYNIYRYLFQEHPRLAGVSPALGIFTYFPYTAGEYFVAYLFIQGGYSWDLVNQAYQKLPVSSEQVMHPEKYLAGEMPVPVNLPDLGPVLGSGWREIDQDVLGEAGFLVWLADRVDQLTAGNGAAGWDGDRYTLWVGPAGRPLLAESSIWATEAEAAEFAEAFAAAMKLRGQAPEPYPGGSTTLWQDAGRVTFLSRAGRRVLLILSPDTTALDRVRSQFAGF